MGVSEILQSIDREIAILQQARALLSGVAAPVSKKSPGRPKKAAAVKTTEATPRKKKRNLTPEGRRRIAEAVKRRWDAQKKSSASTK